jgi:hypothetical protein
MINLEFELLQLKFDFLVAEAKATEGITLPEGFANDYQASITSAHTQAIIAATSSSEVKKAVIDLETEKADFAVAQAVLAASSRGASTLERTQNVGIQGTGSELQSTADQIGAIANIVNPMVESLKELGPNGELVASVAAGAFVISESWSNVAEVFATLGTKAETGMMKASAAAGAMAQTVSSIGSMMAASSNERIAAIDQEINAEKKRDGKSKESLGKIRSLEAKKEKDKKKAFETNKKVMMATTVLNTAAAAMAAWAPPPIGAGPLFGGALTAVILAMGAAQLAVIAGTSYQGGGGGAGAAGGATSVNMGDRSKSVDLATGTSPSGELAFLRGERGIGTGMTNFTPAFSGIRHRAGGGATTGFMVGEQGPELFMPETPGVIKPADESGGNNQRPMAISFQINAIDTVSVEEMLSTNRGAIIKNIREAANQHGEFFLELVQEDSLTK